MVRSFWSERLGRELGLAFVADDIALTTGAFAAIMIAIHQVLEPGDEAIFSEPAWFCYEPMLRAAAAVPRKLKLQPPQYDLDLAAIDAAIGPRTRLVIVNSPHNPTGRIYGREILSDLATLLERASTRIGHRIYLLSDEPYRRLRFDGRTSSVRRPSIRGLSFHTATARYCSPRANGWVTCDFAADAGRGTASG
jgi:aspartate aminotransferase